MTVDPSRLEIELAGLAMLVVVAVAAGLLADAFVPGISDPVVFLGLMALVLAAPAFLDLDPATTESPDSTPTETATGPPASGDGGDGRTLDIELVNWANPIVGETCLLCEEEVVYVPLGGAEGETAHRIECGCTVIESTGKA